MKTQRSACSSSLRSDNVSSESSAPAAIAPALSDTGVSVIATVQIELAQKRSQSDFRLSNEHELAARFDVHVSTIQEAACGVLLEKYVPNFKLQLGTTFQRTFCGAQFDFLLKGHIIEWHPVLLFLTKGGVGSFASQEMYEKFQSRKCSYTDRNERRRYVERVRGVFEYRYKQTRRAILNETSEGQALALIVLHTPQQLFDNVIKPFGSGFPPKARFVSEFNKLTLHLSREHRAKRDQAKKGIEACASDTPIKQREG